MELPEPLVHAVDAHVTDAPPAFLLRHEPGYDDQRRCAAERRVEGLRGTEIAGKLFAEESRRDNDVIGAAEALKHEIAEAPANGVADEKRAREDGHRRGDTNHDCHVGAPVIGQPANDQVPCPHDVQAIPAWTRSAPAGIGTIIAAAASTDTTAASA